MNISRFFGLTNREAMRQVRLALGPDALIVSNRRVSGGVEILATDPTSVPITDVPPLSAPRQAGTPLPGQAAPMQPQAGAAAQATMQPPIQPQRPATPQAGQPPASHRPPAASPMSPMGAYAAAVQAAYGAPPAVASAMPAAPTAPPPAAHGSALSAAPAPAVAPAPQPGIMDAIGAMQGALETRIDELLWGNQLRRAPQAATLFQTLLGFGFSTTLLRAMLKRLPEQLSSRSAFQWARQELISHLPVVASEDVLWQPGLALALVGPTGVGKTTTIAKLAARCVRRFGPDKLILITTDTYRIGAHEQLKIYGEMLRVPVHVVRNANELRDVVRGIRPDQIMLIDNVGISQRDRYIHEQAAMLAAAGRDITRLLVLNAASHGETLDEVARSYAADGGTPLKGCIITKVDEATRLGAALDTALRYRLPIHYVSTGQKVPEHLAFLQSAELVDQALTHLPSARTLYAPTEADFAALLSMTRPPEADSDAAADARRQQLQALPRLLSVAGGPAAQLTTDDLRTACGFIDELGCASEAYDLWRAHTSGDAQKPLSLESSMRHMLRTVQNAWSESGHKHLLALHDQIALRAPGESPGQLRATLILDGQGTPLASPMQQLTLQAGWLSSCGISQPQAPSVRSALLQQFDWLHRQAADLPVVHLFAGGNPALWRELAEGEGHWLSHVPAITRVHMEDGGTTVQALAKTLPHHPVADPDYLFGLAEVAGGPSAERALWVAATTVNIASRGHQALQLGMVSARLVDRSSGKAIRSIIGLHPVLDIPAEKLAAWLVMKAESREALRHVAGAWALLSAPDARAGLQHKALVAAQAGMAAWQLRVSPLADHGRHVAAGMLGRKSMSPAMAVGGLFKLFALKEMMAV